MLFFQICDMKAGGIWIWGTRGPGDPFPTPAAVGRPSFEVGQILAASSTNAIY